MVEYTLYSFEREIRTKETATFHSFGKYAAGPRGMQL